MNYYINITLEDNFNLKEKQKKRNVFLKHLFIWMMRQGLCKWEVLYISE